MCVWRLICDGAGDAAWNMAVDEAILQSVIAGEQPPAMRVYRWAKPSVSLGRFQQKQSILNLSLCRERKVQIVQRLTGGKAVLHGHDLTLCVVAPLHCFFPAHRVLDVHLRLVHALARGFQSVGIHTRPAARADVRVLRGAHAGCFEHALPGDLTTPDGVKLVGGAQYRRAGAVMEQMSIPIEPLPDTLRGCLAPWNEPAPSPLQGIAVGELTEALVKGLADEFGIEWQLSPLSEAELKTAQRLLVKYLQG
ncbi:MAG: hypothetical protein NZ749_12945 [bacterium]|nr:hypothetical protein [bacterium]